MNVLDALTSRRSVRQYDPTDTIPADVLQQLIDIALDTSPTARNRQEIDLLVVADRAKIDAALKITFDSWPADQQAGWNARRQTHGCKNVVSCDCPAIFFFVANERAAGFDWTDFDAGVMSMALMAAARHFGYHTMCLGALRWGDRDGLEAFLGIPKGHMVMALAVGKPIDGPLVLMPKTRLCKARFIE
jgi:nitroreductase